MSDYTVATSALLCTPQAKPKCPTPKPHIRHQLGERAPRERAGLGAFGQGGESGESGSSPRPQTRTLNHDTQVSSSHLDVAVESAPPEGDEDPVKQLEREIACYHRREAALITFL